MPTQAEVDAIRARHFPVARSFVDDDGAEHPTVECAGHHLDRQPWPCDTARVLAALLAAEADAARLADALEHEKRSNGITPVGLAALAAHRERVAK